MPARGTDQPARWVRLQPPLVLAAVPDPILGPEHPSASLAVEHREISNCDAECSRLQVSNAPFLHEGLVANLCFGEWINRH
jgi:hypothetical protein